MLECFETIRCENKQAFNLEYHNRRLNQTRQDLYGLSDKIDLNDYINPPSNELLRCKVIYDNQIKQIDYFTYEKKIVKKLKLVYDENIFYSYKYLNRDIIDTLSEQKGLNDDIILIQNGLVMDTSIANIAILMDDIWITPKKPLLYGTTRQRYIENKKIKEDNIDENMLRSANKIAIMNAMIDFYILDEVEIDDFRCYRR